MQLETVSLRSAFLSATMYPTAIVLLVIGVAAAEDLRYSNEWVVKLEGGNEAADQLALKHGFMNLGQVSAMIDSCLHVGYGFQLSHLQCRLAIFKDTIDLCYWIQIKLLSSCFRRQCPSMENGM